MTVTGKAAQTLDALMTRLGTLITGSPTLPVSYPEVDFTPPADGKYLAAAFFPNRPAWEGLSSGKLDQGILQISVVWPKDVGLIAPLQIAELVKAHFAKRLALISGTTKVTITREPWAAQPLIEDRQVRVPVTISWSA